MKSSEYLLSDCKDENGQTLSSFWKLWKYTELRDKEWAEWKTKRIREGKWKS